jgi:hypothetical protein
MNLLNYNTMSPASLVNKVRLVQLRRQGTQLLVRRQLAAFFSLSKSAFSEHRVFASRDKFLSRRAPTFNQSPNKGGHKLGPDVLVAEVVDEPKAFGADVLQYHYIRVVK